MLWLHLCTALVVNIWGFLFSYAHLHVFVHNLSMTDIQYVCLILLWLWFYHDVRCWVNWTVFAETWQILKLEFKARWQADNSIGCKKNCMALTYVIYTRILRSKNHHFDDLVQDCSISIANALEILQSCTKPLIYPWYFRQPLWLFMGLPKYEWQSL